MAAQTPGFVENAAVTLAQSMEVAWLSATALKMATDFQHANDNVRGGADSICKLVEDAKNQTEQLLELARKVNV